MSELKIEAINRTRREALRSDGVTVPITKLYDLDGEEVSDPKDAVSFVAGSDKAWFSGLLADFDRKPN